MNTKTWIIFGAIVALLLGGLVITSRQNQTDVSNIDVNQIQPATEASGNIADHTTGNTKSKVTLIEYGDFQCPGCKSAAPILETLTEEFKNDIVFVFRNNPLTSIHPNAKAAAAAAESAGLQGKYWQMHHILYNGQNDWSSLAANQRGDAFARYAEQIGVKDIEKFKADMASENVSKKISFDLALGKKAGVSATPTILLNGKQIESETWGDEAKFRAAIEEAIKTAQ